MSWKINETRFIYVLLKIVCSSNPVGFLQSDKVTNSDSVQILTLNTEEDLPEGSWLGDVSNPKARVRVDIPPS